MPKASALTGFELIEIVQNGVNKQSSLNQLTVAGRSAYDEAVLLGFYGTKSQFIESLQGPAGPAGFAGSTGLSGPMGAEGPQGPQGFAGPVGPEGLKGSTGPIGFAGQRGFEGQSGATGQTGLTGPIGLSGVSGPMGSVGPAGPSGAAGAAGALGPLGATGPAGPSGSAGLVGAGGPDGATGPAGLTGATGAAGPVGPAGPIGFDGSTGPQGPTGATGAAGTSSLNSTDLQFSKTSSSLLDSELEGRQVLCELPADKFKTVKFVIEVCYDEIVQATEVLVVSNGVVANCVEYAIINTDHNIATFDTQVIDGKLLLFVTLMHSHSTVIYHYTALTRGTSPAPAYSSGY